MTIFHAETVRILEGTCILLPEIVNQQSHIVSYVLFVRLRNTSLNHVHLLRNLLILECKLEEHY